MDSDLTLQAKVLALGRMLASIWPDEPLIAGKVAERVAEADALTQEILNDLQGLPRNSTREMFAVSREGQPPLYTIRTQAIAYVAHRQIVVPDQVRPTVGEVARVCSMSGSGVEQAKRLLICRHVVGHLGTLGRLSLSQGADGPDGECVVSLSHQLLTWLLGGRESMGGITPRRLIEIMARNQILPIARKGSTAPNRNQPSQSQHQVAGGLPSAKMIFDEARKMVVGCDAALRTLCVRLALHARRVAMLRNNTDPGTPNECVLLIGPSGSGKTWSVQQSCNALRGLTSLAIPFSSFNSTDLTAEGYVGLRPEDAYRPVLQSNGHDARFAVLFYDEFDKRCAGQEYLVIGPAVQSAMLKLIEGATVTVAGRRGGWDSKGVTVDTNGTFFLLAGAHSGLEPVLRRHSGRGARGAIGFSMHEGSTRKVAYLMDALAEYGYIPELVNRLTAVLFTSPPTASSIVKIITGQHGIVTAYNRLLASQGAAIGIDADAAELIADWCLETRGYARGAKMLVARLAEQLVFDGLAGFQLFGTKEVRTAIGEMSASEASGAVSPST